MFHGGCTTDGSLNNSKFNDPMPWIGIYVAGASLICGVAMAMDALHGFRYKKFWFPCKFVTLNATTLTVMAISTKFSVDLNAAMPHRQDQLAKVSSSAFICMVMGNLLPSLGTMEDTELLANIIALGILVVTAITNICIQMGTGVIFEFWMEHALIMVLMVVLLAILCCLSTKKYFLEITYEKKLKKANKVCFTQRNLLAGERLKQDLGKYWMMAYTSSPQFVIGRSAPCLASGAFCLVNLLILSESILRTRLMPWSFRFCSGDSDYKWLTTLVLICQTAAVVVGTVSPAFRWFMTINFRCPRKARHASGQEFVVERYWIKRMLLWQVQPLDLRICSRRGRKLIHGAKFHVLRWLIGMQKGLIFSCKMIRYVSIFFVGRFLRLRRFLKGDNGDDSQNMNMDLSRYVIYLEGEEGLVDLMMENNCDATAHWIKIGENQQPRNLIKLLEGSSSLSSFNENYLEKVKDLKQVWKAAEIVWSEVELCNKWLDVDLSKLAHQEHATGTDVIKSLAEISKQKFMEFVNKDMMHMNICLNEVPSRWPMRVLAANSMYRICETLLLTSQNETNERLFEKISLMICDILLAALSNLQHVISRKCHGSRIEEREKSIRSAVLLFGKTKKILEVIDMKRPQDSDHGKLMHID
ncbi:hypothetical protein L1987_09899 [Smallanthus sonchifolius]|uniref:Uncharacterized protein n=1 Tax=Smallanthus sonchifolius TaxID=185202 RepID=A0ACB9JQP6_9ASTR|nr:hypothetical protein L1987_09899 [Smallanthus sonchifolius]